MKRTTVSYPFLCALVLWAGLYVCALLAPELAEALCRALGPDPAVAILQGEHWGSLIQALLLGGCLFLSPLFFCLERVTLRRAGRSRAHAVTSDRNALWGRAPASRGTAPAAYAILGGLALLFFLFFVLGAGLPEQIRASGRDLARYRAGDPAVYQGPLALAEAPLRNGERQIPDSRFVYYDAGRGSLRCDAALAPRTELMQPAYTVAYLPETGTVLSVTDGAGNLRTGEQQPELTPPEGCWLYGDLPVPRCGGVEGYGALQPEQQALFDLLYSQVLSGAVAAGEVPTRTFDLPYPMERKRFREVLDLYAASGAAEAFPNHGYASDDGPTVRRAYCYAIVRA